MIKNGEVIDIRSDISNRLKKSNSFIKSNKIGVIDAGDCKNSESISSMSSQSNIGKKTILSTALMRRIQREKGDVIGSDDVGSGYRKEFVSDIHGEGIATVQVKWIDGKEIIIAKMYEDDLVFTLKEVDTPQD